MKKKSWSNVSCKHYSFKYFFQPNMSWKGHIHITWSWLKCWLSSVYKYKMCKANTILLFTLQHPQKSCFQFCFHEWPFKIIKRKLPEFHSILKIPFHWVNRQTLSSSSYLLYWLVILFNLLFICVYIHTCPGDLSTSMWVCRDNSTFPHHYSHAWWRIGVSRKFSPGIFCTFAKISGEFAKALKMTFFGLKTICIFIIHTKE